MLKNKKGFTLIEVVIVIVIIAILAAILVPNMTKWIDKAKLGTLKSEADSVQKAVIAQVAQGDKDGLPVSDVTSANITEVDAKFWETVSDAANKTLQTTDEDADGYVKFTYVSGKLTEFVYSSGGHTATSDGKAWSYE